MSILNQTSEDQLPTIPILIQLSQASFIMIGPIYNRRMMNYLKMMLMIYKLPKMLNKLIISYQAMMVRKQMVDIAEQCQKDSPKKEMIDS